MIIIIAFTAASFITSALVLSACALSSRISQKEGVIEYFVECEELAPKSAKTVTPFSVN